MDPKSSRQLPATSPSARAVGGSTPGMPCGTATATGPPSRTASAELARTAPLAVARWLWCGDAGTSAGSTGLHNVRKQRSARLSLVLCSGELGGRSVVRRCRLPSVCCLRPPQPVSAPLALVPRDLVRTQGGRPAIGATGLHTPPPKKEKHRKSLWKPVAGVAALPVCWLRPPPLLVVPALRVLVLLLPVFRRSHSWQPRKRIRRNGAYVYHVVPSQRRCASEPSRRLRSAIRSLSRLQAASRPRRLSALAWRHPSSRPSVEPSLALSSQRLSLRRVAAGPWPPPFLLHS